jgi:hypothetical protein
MKELQEIPGSIIHKIFLLNIFLFQQMDYYDNDDYYYIYACEEHITEAQIPYTFNVWDIITNFLTVAKCIMDHTSLLDPQASGAPALEVRAPILLVLTLLGK